MKVYVDERPRKLYREVLGPLYDTLQVRCTCSHLPRPLAKVRSEPKFSVESWYLSLLISRVYKFNGSRESKGTDPESVVSYFGRGNTGEVQGLDISGTRIILLTKFYDLKTRKK